VERALAESDELGRLLREEGDGLPLGGVLDMGPMLEHAAKGGLLEPGDLLSAASVLRSLVRLRDFVEARQARLPLAWTRAEHLVADTTLARTIERSFDAGGALVDDASPRLGELRGRVRGLTKSIQARLDSLLHDPAFTPHLRDGYYSLRNDRYVFPVLASSRSAVPGIVHNASQSGQTLFVEPSQLVTIGNDLAIAQSMVAEEERRILQDLSMRLGAKQAELDDSIAAAAELDEHEASARLALDLGASAPHIVDATAPFRLLAMRHPLLALKKGDRVVANDLDLDERARVLVISGPNAGGKTVTLTGLGLCALMLRAGLAIPAERDSSLPLFVDVESAIGDDQDLDRDLSTFSAHLSALRDIGAAVGPGSLVLIDELAADTDPREGAALALAILEDFSSRGGRVVITTHLEELKALGLTHPGFVNARVGFDPQKLSPTYRLKFGEAGTSSAIEIARRMGLPESVCRRARETLESRQGPLGQALDALDKTRRELSQTQQALAAERRQVEAALSQLKAAHALVQEKAHAIEIEERARLVGDLEKARDEVREVIRALQAAPSPRAANQVRERLDEVLKKEAHALDFKRAEAALPAASRAAMAHRPIEPGMCVQVPGLGEAVVLALEGNEAVVSLGALKVRRRRDELLALPGKAAAKRDFPKSQPRDKKLEKMRAGAIEAPDSRLDLRGTRVDEGIRAAEAFLDKNFSEGRLSVTIVHGHGTGALRQALGDYLSASPYVASFRFGDEREGGTGATIVTFKS
jgi:DNA mismatch repair protein MutS2